MKISFAIKKTARCFSSNILSSTSSIASIKSDFKKNLEESRKDALLGGGLKRIQTQHSRGKLTARERISLLLDENSFNEYDMFKTHRCDEFDMQNEQYFGDGVVTGHGLINGRKVSNAYLFSTLSKLCISNCLLIFF